MKRKTVVIAKRSRGFQKNKTEQKKSVLHISSHFSWAKLNTPPVQSALIGIRYHYKVLIIKLFLRYNLTMGVCRKGFRNFKLGAFQSYKEFLDRLQSSLKKWTDLAKVSEILESLMCFCVKDLFFRTFTTYFRGRNLQNVS